MRHPGIAIILLAAAAWPGPAAGQAGNPAAMKPASEERAPGTPAPTEVNAQDRLFVQLIGAGGLAEVDTGRLAGARGGSAAVKSFGERMVEDHSRAGEQLATLAKESGIRMPTEPAPDQKAMRDRLEALQGPPFDLAYLRGQLVEHQKAVQILAWEISSGQGANLQRFAAATLPAVLEHLAMVQRHLSELTGAASQGLAAAAEVPARSSLGPAGK